MSIGAPSPSVLAPRHVLLADGTAALLRPLVAADHDAVLRLHERASDRSIHNRFFSLNRRSVRPFVDRICAPTPTCFSLVAMHQQTLVGVASAVENGGGGTAEVALLVDDSMHGVGIGSVMLEELAHAARRRGLTGFTAEVLAENSVMLRVFHDLGYRLEAQRDHEVVLLSLDLTLDENAVAAADTRHRRSISRSLRPLFEPSSVAVVGVSRRRGGIGREVVENLQADGYSGHLLAVGRPGLTLPGVDCVTDIDALPAGLDLSVVAVPGEAVEGTLAQLARRGNRTAVVLTSGLAEAGGSGADTERRLADLATSHGMRLVGPNCFGVLSNLRSTRLNATFGTARPRPGGLAVGSQSGGVGIALLHAATVRELGVASFVSLGNKADVSGNDLLAAWTEDPDVHAGALYLEGFHDPRTFARLAAEMCRAKPLLVAFGGSSAAGVRAGASHTAAHATPARALRALFRAAGVVEVEDLDDLVDTAALLTEQPAPRGPRLGVVSNAGGLGILAADAAQRRKLLVPELSPALRGQLAVAVPGGAGFGNPVDLGAAASPEAFSRAATLLVDSGEVDALLVIVAATAVTDTTGIVDDIEAGLANAGLPCMSVVVGSEAPAPSRTTGFRSADSAVRSLAHACAWTSWQQTASTQLRLRAEALRLEEDKPTTAPEGQDRWLDVASAEHLLAPAGIAMVPYSIARSEREVAVAVRRLGTPVVVKTADPDAVHKTEMKLVVPDLTTIQDAVQAMRGMRAATGDHRMPVLVQKQVDGVELAYGVVRDARFGPLVMVSSGGTALDLWNDQAFLMPPLDREGVRASLASLRTWPLLCGFRGSAPLDVEAVIDQVVALGRLAVQRDDLLELDLNPVIVTDRGPVCVDAKVRVRASGEPAT